MKKTVTSMFALLMISVGSVYATVNLELEPCINGEVSASGNFPSQAQEDEFYLEPCINGGVSADGLSR